MVALGIRMTMMTTMMIRWVVIVVAVVVAKQHEASHIHIDIVITQKEKTLFAHVGDRSILLQERTLRHDKNKGTARPGPARQPFKTLTKHKASNARYQNETEQVEQQRRHRRIRYWASHRRETNHAKSSKSRQTASPDANWAFPSSHQ